MSIPPNSTDQPRGGLPRARPGSMDQDGLSRDRGWVKLGLMWDLIDRGRTAPPFPKALLRIEIEAKHPLPVLGGDNGQIAGECRLKKGQRGG